MPLCAWGRAAPTSDQATPQGISRGRRLGACSPAPPSSAAVGGPTPFPHSCSQAGPLRTAPPYVCYPRGLLPFSPRSSVGPSTLGRPRVHSPISLLTPLRVTVGRRRAAAVAGAGLRWGWGGGGVPESGGGGEGERADPVQPRPVPEPSQSPAEPGRSPSRSRSRSRSRQSPNSGS